MTVDDAAHAFELNSDPEVVRYTGDGPFASVEAAADFLAAYDHYRRYGFGRWAVERIEDGEWLGWCGLKYTPSKDEYDLGFRFLRRHWGLGYATEAALACLRLGFHDFGMEEIVGRAMAENSASIRVLEKVGMQLVGPYDFDGEAGVLYRIDKGMWLSRNPM
ncbi:MAG: GNAT family N-acetyltransferase [Bacteroidia bacterium]